MGKVSAAQISGIATNIQLLLITTTNKDLLSRTQKQIFIDFIYEMAEEDLKADKLKPFLEMLKEVEERGRLERVSRFIKLIAVRLDTVHADYPDKNYRLFSKAIKASHLGAEGKEYLRQNFVDRERVLRKSQETVLPGH